MTIFGTRTPTSDTAPATDTETRTQPAYSRALVAVEHAGQAERLVEAARQAGASEARVLHLNLRENFGRSRFALETESEASKVVEVTVFELRLAGVAASGQVRQALVGKAAEAIIADAAEWGADVIVLGPSRHGQLAARLFGSVTLRVLQRATCPVLVAHPAGSDRQHRIAEERYAGQRS